jgi:hypothetical protein
MKAIERRPDLGKNAKPYLKNTPKQKELESWLK